MRKIISCLVLLGAFAMALVSCRDSRGEDSRPLTEAETKKKEDQLLAEGKEYESLKLLIGTLSEKQTAIMSLGSQMKAIHEKHKDRKKEEWPAEDTSQMVQLSAYLAGAIASFNSFAHEYNWRMAKLKWRFTNPDLLPLGESKTLPRAFDEYTKERTSKLFGAAVAIYLIHRLWSSSGSSGKRWGGGSRRRR